MDTFPMDSSSFSSKEAELFKKIHETRLDEM